MMVQSKWQRLNQWELPMVPEDDWEDSVLLSTEMTHRCPFLWFLIRNCMNSRSSWCWVFDHWYHLLDLNVTEQSQLIRIVSKLDLDSVIVVAELEVVGLEILWVDLVVTFEQADLEGIDEYCKLPLSTVNLNLLCVAEEILENSILLALCSTNIDLRYVLISHKLSRLIFPCCSLILCELFGLDPNWHPADFDSMTKWSIDLCPLTWSCLFLSTCPSDSESLRTLFNPFLFCPFYFWPLPLPFLKELTSVFSDWSTW